MPTGLLTDYINAAMGRSHFETMENGRVFGSIDACRGVWADGAKLEETREELQRALESWLLFGLRHSHDIPVLEGIDLNLGDNPDVMTRGDALLVIPHGDDDLIDSPLLERILQQAGIDPTEWDKFDK